MTTTELNVSEKIICRSLNAFWRSQKNFINLKKINCYLIEDA